MQRRDFLRGLVAGGVVLGLPGWARADETRDTFVRNLPAHPRLAALGGCTSDMLSGEAVMEGRWPTELSGTFFRNGPGRFERNEERYHHWFDGDGMVQAWHIDGAHVRHEARFVRTQKYVEEAAAGQFLFPGFGTEFERRPVASNDTINTANTNALPHAGKLYAMWEGGSATELDPVTLATRGIKTWRPDLAAVPFSAHPKITPDGVLWNFGVVPGANKLALWRIDADGSLGKFGLLNIPHLAMVHDFVVTARYMVFLVPPFDMRNRPGASFMEMHIWNGNRPMRAVIVNRADFSLNRIIEMPAGMAFHFGNGWDEGNTIRLDACLSADDSVLKSLGGAMRGEEWKGVAHSDSVLFTLDLTRGTARTEKMLRDTEFPRVAFVDVGSRYRKLFLTTCRNSKDFGMTGVASFDMESGKVDRYDFGEDWIVEEHIPVPKASGKGQWLLGVAYDVRKRQTVLDVFDDAHISRGPVATARLPYAAPLCFHGNFLAT